MSNSTESTADFKYMYKKFDRTMPLPHGILKVDANNPERKQLFALLVDEESALKVVDILNGIPDDLSELEELFTSESNSSAVSRSKQLGNFNPDPTDPRSVFNIFDDGDQNE